METKKNINVLLADDDQDDREFFSEVVSEIAPKAKIQMVKNGTSVIEFIDNPDTELPDIIFLDLNMPCKNGNECLREIKRNDKYRYIPVIIYSTSSHVKDIENAYNNGADLYVTKPNTYNDLKKILKKLLTIDWGGFVLNHRIEKFVFK